MSGVEGINFPLTEAGRRSTTVLGKRVLEAALGSIDETAAARVRAEPKWRRRYPRHFRKLEELSLASPAAAEAIAAAGLKALYREMVFVREGEPLPLKEAMNGVGESRLHTAVVEGMDKSPPGELSVPYRGRLLSGDALLRQIEDWEERGIVEPSCGAALRRVQSNPHWLDLSDFTFILLGAAAEMGPFRVLCRWRATIAAVDLDRVPVWEYLIATARAGNGRLILPLRCEYPSTRDDAALAFRAGANLLVQTPEIASWLSRMQGPLVIGGYAYLDGAKHVRVALAMDAIMRQLAESRDDVTYALLPTPSDVFAVPQEAAEMAQQRYRHRSTEKLWQGPVRALSGGHFFTPNVTETWPLAPGKRVAIVDSLVLQQGPNYALAKRLQRWRAVRARRKGVRVSSNVAPSTKTMSVLHNIALASAYAGAGHFGVEIFETATSNALMAALLVHDLRNDKALANPRVPIDHPAELFMEGANHGGLWRVAFSPRSVLEIAAILGWRAAHHPEKAN